MSDNSAEASGEIVSGDGPPPAGSAADGVETQVTTLVDAPPVSDEQVGRTVEAAALAGGVSHAQVHIVLCDDEEIAGVHDEFFDDPTPTDVITFPINGTGQKGDPIVGEIMVSVETAARAAAEQGHDATVETLLYVVHGVLHLAGFDDRTPADRVKMRKLERVALQELGLSVQNFE